MTDGELLCPSADASWPDARVIGVVLGEPEQPRVGYLARPVPLTPQLVESTEPAGPGYPVLQHPKVISSPHIAGVTVEAMDAVSVMAARNILSVFDGSPILENVVNPEVVALAG